MFAQIAVKKVIVTCIIPRPFLLLVVFVILCVTAYNWQLFWFINIFYAWKEGGRGRDTFSSVN